MSRMQQEGLENLIYVVVFVAAAIWGAVHFDIPGRAWRAVAGAVTCREESTQFVTRDKDSGIQCICNGTTAHSECFCVVVGG